MNYFIYLVIFMISTISYSGAFVGQFTDEYIESLYDEGFVESSNDNKNLLIVDDMIFDLDNKNLKDIEPGARKWPNNVLVYQFDRSVTNSRWRNAFINACLDWQREINIICRERTNEPHYALVHASNDNSAMVGFQGGVQDINITSWNEPFRIMHEIAHTLGIIHEHVRSDRDTYVTYHPGNVDTEARKRNYIKVPSSTLTLYDYWSVMHYGADYFAKPNTKTLTVKQNNLGAKDGDIGNRQFLPELDVIGLALVYGGNPTNLRYPVRNFVGATFNDSFSKRFNRASIGYNIAVNGPTGNYTDVSINHCTETYYEAKVISQDIQPNTNLQFDHTLNVITNWSKVYTNVIRGCIPAFTQE